MSGRCVCRRACVQVSVSHPAQKSLRRRCSLACRAPPRGVEKSRRQPGIIGRRPCCLGNSCECQRDITPSKLHRRHTSQNSIFRRFFFFLLFFGLRISLTDGEHVLGFLLPREEPQDVCCHTGTVAISKNVVCMCTFSNIIKNIEKWCHYF